MVLGFYQPTSIEAAVLVGFLTLGAAAGSSLAYISAAFQWKLWYKSHRVRPMMFQPYYFTLLYLGFALMFAGAFWVAWKEGFELENGLPNSSGDVPATGIFLGAWITGASSLLLMWLAPQTFWIAGVDLKMMGLALFAQFLTWGSLLAATVLFWLIYWVAGLLALFPLIYSTYVFYVTWYFYTSDGGVVSFNPFDFVALTTCPKRFAAPQQQQYVVQSPATGPYYTQHQN